MTTYDFIAANKRKTVLLLLVFFALVMFIGWVADRAFASGGAFIVVAAAYSMVTALASYYTGDRVALMLSGAQEVTEEENPYVVRMVDNLCISQGMPRPRVHIIRDAAINAFATGRDPEHASIAVTTGAIEKLENEELEGVLAHELSHVKNYDIRVMTLVIVLVGTITILGDLVFRSWFWGGSRRRNEQGGGAIMLIGLILLIFAPIVAQLIKLAISRRREYLADSSAALMTRYPEGLAGALSKIALESRPMARTSAATAHLFIANPLSGRTLAAMFSTHPPVEKRIDALRRMSGAH